MTAHALTVEVTGPAYEAVLGQLIDDKVASGIARKDPTLWGPDAEAESSVRLGWVDLPASSRPLAARILQLREELRAEGLDHVVLCGMGGSSLAPEVITGTYGVELTILDSTDPGVLRRALADRLDRTVVVVSSKSGTTVETDSQRRAYAETFRQAGLDPARRIVVVTDPGSPLAGLGETGDCRTVFLADPTVGGRFSALSPFGLVPSGLAGVDVAELLDDADAVRELLAEDSPGNPALVLGALLGAAHQAGRDKVVIGRHDSGVVSFAAWAEQLIAESTGKDGRGLLPVDVDDVTGAAWQAAGDDATRIALGTPVDGIEHVAVHGPLGALFLLWETAVAVAGRVIGINPFDQPNVEEAKHAARTFLDAPPSGAPEQPAFVDGAIAAYGDPELLGDAATVAGALRALRRAVPDRGYLAVLAYLDPHGESEAARIRAGLAAGEPYPVTFGWGPRFLHSTGQYHKGGHPNGAFLQLTGFAGDDVTVPARPYTFGQLIAAQAAGDLAVLRDKPFPALRLHLLDRAEGLAQLLGAVRDLADQAGGTTAP